MSSQRRSSSRGTPDQLGDERAATARPVQAGVELSDELVSELNV
jgi:hypothetical protein